MPMKWPTGAPVICGRAALGEHVVELAGLEADGPVGVDDALRVAGRARGEPDDRRASGSTRPAPTTGRAIEQDSNGRAASGRAVRGAVSPTTSHSGPGRAGQQRLA